MHGLYNNLVSICMILEKELIRVVDKLESTGGVISPSDMDYVDTLTHAIKSVVTTKAMLNPTKDYEYTETHEDTKTELKSVLTELMTRIESM